MRTLAATECIERHNAIIATALVTVAVTMTAIPKDGGSDNSDGDSGGGSGSDSTVNAVRQPQRAPPGPLQSELDYSGGRLCAISCRVRPL